TIAGPARGLSAPGFAGSLLRRPAGSRPAHVVDHHLGVQALVRADPQGQVGAGGAAVGLVTHADPAAGGEHPDRAVYRARLLAQDVLRRAWLGAALGVAVEQPAGAPVGAAAAQPVAAARAQ